MNSLHVTRHLVENKAHCCLWDGCGQTFTAYEDISHHVSQVHDIPNEWTIHTKMHYCFEHDTWCKSNLTWNFHLGTSHLNPLNRFTGLIRQGGVLIVAAHCLFCLGDERLFLARRFEQYRDNYTLRKHMKGHLETLSEPLQDCPHPLCEQRIHSEQHFWDHAIDVHGVPEPGPERITAKRKFEEENSQQAR